MDEEKLKLLGQQLRCPSGKFAEEVGASMFKSNSNMIFQTIEALDLCDGAVVLELGFGNGEHVTRLLEQFIHLNYYGIDISEAMVSLASQKNSSWVEIGRASFELVAPEQKLVLKGRMFDAFFSVNTVYFWEDPASKFKEIHDLLNIGGTLSIGYVEKDFGHSLPFTQQGFRFYSNKEIEGFLKDAGFSDISFLERTEQTVAKDRNHVVRPFVVAKAVK